jgi:hypothetical protein
VSSANANPAPTWCVGNWIGRGLPLLLGQVLASAAKISSRQGSKCLMPGCAAGRIPPPSPGCFLEVLILKGFETNVSEVLILKGLLSRVLILLDFKSFIISDLIKNEDFMEVLILGGLGRAFGMDVWI